MAVLVWDAPGEKVYESGLDKGVLYLSDGSAVPWNGLTSVIEHFDKESQPVYYDGMKINDLIILGDFSATMKAVTYPEEFLEIEGVYPVKSGVFYGDQRPLSFGLCYRTQIGNDIEGDSAGYKIHIIYNLTAVPSEKTYASVKAEPSLVEFEWNITAVPEEIPGFRPSAHIIIDSRTVDPLLLAELEALLYGTDIIDATLLPMSVLVTYIGSWFRIQIIDHGDGTWSADSDIDGLIEVDEIEQSFTIPDANAVYLDAETYEITDTTGITE